MLMSKYLEGENIRVCNCRISCIAYNTCNNIIGTHVLCYLKTQGDPSVKKGIVLDTIV